MHVAWPLEFEHVGRTVTNRARWQRNECGYHGHRSGAGRGGQDDTCPLHGACRPCAAPASSYPDSDVEDTDTCVSMRRVLKWYQPV